MFIFKLVFWSFVVYWCISFGFFLYLFKNLRLILKTKTGSELIYEKQTGFKKAIWFGLIICFKKTNAD
jgi:hypothetical protein